MLIKCDNSYKIEIQDYIGDQYYRCLYLYLDLIKYGCESPNIKLWLQKDNDNIQSVILKYYTGMHVFSKEYNINLDEVKELIEYEKPSIVCGEPDTIDMLNNGQYNSELGWIRKLEYIERSKCEEIHNARKEDFISIAKLIYEDQGLGSSYRFEELANQLYERNIEKYARNYVIYDNNCVVSHAATGAENEKVAILSYVITDPKYRGKGLANKICSKLCYDLINEGKTVFLVNYTKESTALYEKLGFKICCEWEKLYLDLKEN